jgi:hypothetical protein
LVVHAKQEEKENSFQEICPKYETQMFELKKKLKI